MDHATDTEPLHDLAEQSAGAGTWILMVVNEAVESEYNWRKGSYSGMARKLEYVLVTANMTQYCEGVYKRSGKEPNATENFDRAKSRFKRGTVWKVSKVCLAKQNSKYLDCSCKVVIDMNMSIFQPMPQSTVKMPTQAAPPTDLATLLNCTEIEC